MVSPPELTEVLADALIADSGVSNLVVLTGSARRPDGDAVHFDVLDRSANSVLRQVQALQGDHRGSILIESVDAAIGEELGPVTKQGRIMWRPRSRAEQPAAGSALSASEPSAGGGG